MAGNDEGKAVFCHHRTHRAGRTGRAGPTCEASVSDRVPVRYVPACLHHTTGKGSQGIGIDPHAITPALEEEKQKKGFDYFSFETPPVVEGQVWGRWRERERTGLRIPEGLPLSL